MNAVILHQSIAADDPIGIDIRGMYQILNRRHQCYVYGDDVLQNDLDRLDKSSMLELLANPENMVIYHHSRYWPEGESFLDQAKARIIIKYHPITPEWFFLGVSEDDYRKCCLGREQTSRLAHKNISLWMSDSHYNHQELEHHFAGYQVVMPPFHLIDLRRQTRPDEETLKYLLEDDRVNLLSVGGVTPDKGHDFLVRIVKDYCLRYDGNIVLHIIGKKNAGLSRATDHLDHLINEFGLAGRVRFLDDVNDQMLLAFYLGCDCFISGSRHEGFGMRLVEAQSLYLPVIARKLSSVEERLGPGQILLGEDPAEYAKTIRRLARDKEYRTSVIQTGYRNYQDRFTTGAIERLFVDALAVLTGIEL
ncbi:MAG: glycosyltransferase family 4 protein [Deltaproteobacteria bacterium]|nr:glycosyltransferase family 4 protein [Deltaproteobacteria bacterium]MBF0526577.1 glycosyltransferase family 4 protein [Deltaproteobacteria bacterium]